MATKTEYLKLGMPDKTEAVLEGLEVFNENAEKIDANAKALHELLSTTLDALREAILAGDTESAVAILDEAILDLSVLG